VQSVGLFEAWSLWWQGKSVQGMSLWGMPMLVVGRVGKIMAFAGSVVAVIDIIGPTRIREWGARTKRANPQKLTERIQENPHYGALTLAFAVAGSVIALSAFFGAGLGLLADAILAILATVGLVVTIFSFLLLIAHPLVRGLGRVLESERWERVVRWFGFTLIIVGFSFDLLAS
jgi:hypothetical protein